MLITAISDLHGTFPKVPSCDLLIIAGDLCPDVFGGLPAKRNPVLQKQWFEWDFLQWLRKQPAEFKVITWGNHDYCGHLIPNKHYPKNIHVVSDGMIMIDGIKLWLTPWSNQFMDWAWMKPHAELAAVYAQIPEDVDILVSHQPPYGYGDVYPDLGTGKMEHIASSELLYTIERVKPKVVVCGHLHGGHGTYQHGETTIYNVSVLNEGYQLAYPVTQFEFDPPATGVGSP